MQRKGWQKLKKNRKSHLTPDKLELLQSVGFVFEIRSTCGVKRGPHKREGDNWYTSIVNPQQQSKGDGVNANATES